MKWPSRRFDYQFSHHQDQNKKIHARSEYKLKEIKLEGKPSFTTGIETFGHGITFMYYEHHKDLGAANNFQLKDSWIASKQALAVF